MQRHVKHETKSSFFRTIATITTVLFGLTTYSCTTCKPIPLETAADVQSLKFSPEKKYNVLFPTGPQYRLSGDRLTTQNDLIGVRFDGDEGFRYYQREQFTKICAEEFNKRKTVLAAVLGGAGGLALVVGIIVLSAFAGFKT